MKKIILLSLLLISCTCHASNKKITLYSGGKEIRSWVSEGDVKGISHAFFTERGTGKLIEIWGTIVVEDL